MGARDFGNTALLNVPDTMGGPDAALPSIMGSADPAGLPAIMGPRGGASDIMTDRPFPYASVAPLRQRVTPLNAPVLE
jgi:hypothetical protein